MSYIAKMGKISVILLTATLFVVLPVVDAYGAVELTNPLNYDTVEDLISALIDWLFTLALAIVPMVIVVAGYFFVTSAGDPAKVTLARNMVIYALVGLLIIMLSRGIIALIEEVLQVQ